MTDIVERLLNAKANGDPKKYAVWMTVADAHEAGAEIARLRAEIASHKEALEWVVEYMKDYPHHNAPCIANARKIIQSAGQAVVS